MQQCDHKGHLRYVRRIFKNGTQHFGVQCSKCLDMVKTTRHNNKLFITLAEIPAHSTIHEYIDPELNAEQGGLFDE
jgi:hypothetical protein